VVVWLCWGTQPCAVSAVSAVWGDARLRGGVTNRRACVVLMPFCGLVGWCWHAQAGQGMYSSSAVCLCLVREKRATLTSAPSTRGMTRILRRVRALFVHPGCLQVGEALPSPRLPCVFVARVP